MRPRLSFPATLLAGCALVSLPCGAQESPAPPVASVEVASLAGRSIERIEVLYDTPLWAIPVDLHSVRVGQIFTPEVVRRALDELADSGRFGDLRSEVEPTPAGVVLRIRVVARRVVASLRIAGVSDGDELLRAAEIRAGGELTALELPELGRRLERELERRGYTEAKVRVDTFDADDPMAVVLSFDVTRGEAARVAERRFFVWPDPALEGVSALLATYGVGRGDRVDRDSIDAANRSLEESFRRGGFYDARVESTVERKEERFALEIKVYAGSRIRLRIEGNRRFDAGDIEASLNLDEATDRSPAGLAQRIEDYYVARGFFDIDVTATLLGRENAPTRTLLLSVHEGDPLRVAAREYPCLSPQRPASEVGSEIDSFLSELPGGTLVDAVDPRVVDSLFGPHNGAGARPAPYPLNPWSVYSPDVYDRAIEHLKDLFRSEGYLSARVGPVLVARRRCDVRSPAGQCLPVGPRVRPTFACSYEANGVPADEPVTAPELECREDRAKGVYCEPDAVVSIPIKLGPRSFIESVSIDGNLMLPDEELLKVAELKVETPVSQAEVDRARRRLLDRYAEEGFAFADIEASLELSPNHTRAKVIFAVSERKQVRVSRIVVRGARRTSESLIRGRIALEAGGFYRRSLLRKTEERLATLGVFSSVSVGLEDPYVPASEKVVLVTVQEKVPQGLDALVGFSTGEGVRLGFQYRHANIGGQAIRFTFQARAGLLPLPLIFEDDVRDKYEQLDILERLERRNTATVEFPDIGLGPLFRLSVEGVDVLDNARDYGLTKDAGILTLFFVPERRLSFQIAGSLERNRAKIFGPEQKNALENYLQMNPNLARVFRVPEGTTFVVAQRVGASWDRRDNPLQATRGTFVSVDVEHATARPIDATAPVDPQAANVFQPVKSDFLRFSNRVSGYLRLSRRGLALAGSFRWGLNRQLNANSRTYPDRLFFLGGVDSLRGFLQDSVVPEDVAQRLLDPSAMLTIDKVVIRGGDFFINPRLELRIPVNDTFEAATFLDTGNLWAEPFIGTRDLLRLRYAAGAGVRVGTPIGPLVFDYGFNIERVLDAVDPTRSHQRYWEDIGAFHFSIGLF